MTLMNYGGALHGFSFGVGLELVRRIVVPAILIATPLFCWWYFGPDKPDCDLVRRDLAHTAAGRVAECVRAGRGEIRRAAVLHLVNDPTDYMTEALRERLVEGGLLDLDSTPTMEKFRNLLNLRNPGCDDVDKARAYARKHNLDAVIIGTLDRFETIEGKGVLTGKVRFVRIAQGDVIEIPLSDIPPEGLIASVLAEVPPSYVTRTICLVVAILLLIVFISRIVYTRKYYIEGM